MNFNNIIGNTILHKRDKSKLLLYDILNVIYNIAKFIMRIDRII